LEHSLSYQLTNLKKRLLSSMLRFRPALPRYSIKLASAEAETAFAIMRKEQDQDQQYCRAVRAAGEQIDDADLLEDLL
jgi:hypothetical protein